MKKGTVLGAVLLSLILLVSGCGGAGEPKGNEPAQPASTDAAGKPAEAKPTEPAPTEAKPAETTAEDKPAEAKPAETRYVIVAGESKASYEVKEVFLIDALNATATGASTAITGDLVLENGLFKPSTVVVDVTKLKSDRAQRDGVLRTRGLETGKYGTAEFTVLSMEGEPVVGGQEVAVRLTGKAKIHGVEKDLTWDGKARLEGDTLKLTATVAFPMDLFGIEPPNIAGKIRVDDGVKLMVDLVAKQG